MRRSFIKYKIINGIILICFLLIFSFCKKKDISINKQKSDITNSSKKTWKFGCDPLPPYHDLSDKKNPGFSTEILRHVFKKMDIKIEFKEYNRARVIQMTFNGELDGAFSASITEERLEYCYYPEEPVAHTVFVLYIRTEDKDRLKFESYDDLIGKQIGVVRSFSYSKEFWDFVKKHNNYEEVTEDITNLEKLVNKRIDYLITNHANMVILVKKQSYEGKVMPILSKVILEDPMYLMFSKKTTSPEFVKKFSNTLKKFKQTKTYKKLYKKYFK